jgi:hypothetical protein
MTANGGSEPYPIPWLDKNGSHNQPARPNFAYLSLQGLVARCRTSGGQQRESNRIRQPDHTLRTDARRILGCTRYATRCIRAHMTDAISGAGGPRQPDSRLPSSDRTSGLYCVVPVPASAVTMSADRKTITLEMTDVPVADQPR